MNVTKEQAEIQNTTLSTILSLQSVQYNFLLLCYFCVYFSLQNVTRVVDYYFIARAHTSFATPLCSKTKLF